MKEVLPAREFSAWLQAFLPGGPGSLGEAPVVADRADPKQAISTASRFRAHGACAGSVSTRPRSAMLAAGMPHAVGGHYVGSHWLASFAALALGERP